MPKRSLENRTKPRESVLPICSPHPAARPPLWKGGLMRCRSAEAGPSSIHFSWKCLRFHDSSLVPYAILSLYFDRHRAGCFGQHPLWDEEVLPSVRAEAGCTWPGTHFRWHRFAPGAQLSVMNHRLGNQKRGYLLCFFSSFCFLI